MSSDSHSTSEPNSARESAEAAVEATDGATPLRTDNVIEHLSRLSHDISSLTGQMAFQRQQLAQVYDAVRQLFDAVSLQCRQLLESDRSIQQEMARFQSGGPQRAMAGVFHKLFRDLVQHVSALDDLLRQTDDHQPSDGERAWFEAVRVLRDGFEATLKEWGAPIPVAVGTEEFNPEVHNAVESVSAEAASSELRNIIVRVCRRGWALQGQVLVPPQVVVG